MESTFTEKNRVDDESIEDAEEEDQASDWGDWEPDDDDSEPNFACLFCNSKWMSAEALFEHCKERHSFDFQEIRRSLHLDFYDLFKLINYVRSQVAANKCWSCGLEFQCSQDLLNHLHAANYLNNNYEFPWKDDRYLKPFVEDDVLLHSFDVDEMDQDEQDPLVDREELLKDVGVPGDLAEICMRDENSLEGVLSKLDIIDGTSSKDANQHTDFPIMNNDKKNVTANGLLPVDNGFSGQKQKGKKLMVSFANVAAQEIKKINESYFGAYSSFRIHREMISDKVRTDSYRNAILNNPSLMNRATVVDVGCGTGILSLFAAQAGASRVYAVEASQKMAAVASQIAQDNGFLRDENKNNENKKGIIVVLQSMVEELIRSNQVPSQSVDVLVSEWMGYCLLYESMLSSVLLARDKWLKPGGAILPDVATMFAAGFGRGATSIPFWEDVYGFDMSCIGNEVAEDSDQHPIVDVVDSGDIVTGTSVVKTFDLATMEPDDVDFTSSFELEPNLNPIDSGSKITQCYGIVLWFDTAFTSRFCREAPGVLSTSPYKPKTHWSQTIFTFKEPICMTTSNYAPPDGATVGTDACPVAKIGCRISIARAAQHRSIDISLEVCGISVDGRKRSWPVQIFNLQ